MKSKATVLVLAIYVAQTYCQSIPFPPQLLEPTIVNPVVASTIVDNSVSNSLANALQLLIVSNLIQNTINANNAFNPYAALGTINGIESVIPPVSTVPIVEAINPPFDYVPDAQFCGNPIDISAPYGVDTMPPVAPIYPNFVPNYPEFCNVPVVEPFNYFPTVTPVAAEVLFPPTIPAQLKCNFGYGPDSMPCVNVNVEPCPPFGYAPFGPGYFY